MSPTVVRVTLGWPLILSLLAMLVVGALSWPLALDGAWAWYDTLRPVASAQIHGIWRDKNGDIRADITTTKHRACDRVAVYGYVHWPSARMERTTLDRPDGPVGVGHLDVGEAIRSTWRVVGSADAVGVSVRIEYDCAGRPVVTRLVEIPPDKLMEYLR